MIAATDDMGAANIGRLQYTGQMWLPELAPGAAPWLGMYYYKARIYSPTLGRFMQTDPIGYDDQINLYAYVGNDPVNQTDPSGKCPNCIGGFIIGAGADYVLQVANGMAEGKSLREAATSVNVKEVIGSGLLGAVSGGAAAIAKVGQAAKVTGTAVKLSRTEKVVVRGHAAVVGAAAGAAQAKISGQDVAKGAAKGAGSVATAPERQRVQDVAKDKVRGKIKKII